MEKDNLDIEKKRRQEMDEEISLELMKKGDQSLNNILENKD